MPTTTPSTRVIEVEEKFHLSRRVDVERRLLSGGFALKGEEMETDVYFTDPAGEFVRNRTCLRVRTNRDGAELTFKGKSKTLASSYAKVEHNMRLLTGTAQDMCGLLESLGYHEYVTVEKTRRSFSKSTDGLQYTFAIDTLAGIGAFVELEILAPLDGWSGREEELRARLATWIDTYSDLGLDKADLPYRDFAAGHLKRNVLKADDLRAMVVDFDIIATQTDEHVGANLTALKALAARGIKLAAISNESRTVVEERLAGLGCESLFVAVVSRENASGGGIASSAFLAVTELMGIETSKCLAVVGSKREADAAASAGANCVGVRDAAVGTIGEAVDLGVPEFGGIKEIAYLMLYA